LEGEGGRARDGQASVTRTDMASPSQLMSRGVPLGKLV
jgi:hypothetical protein